MQIPHSEDGNRWSVAAGRQAVQKHSPGRVHRLPASRVSAFRQARSVAGSRSVLSKSLLVVQVAVSLVLLIAAGLLLCIAAVNKLYLTPRLMNRDPKAVGLLRLSIRAEMVCASLILLITAAFTTLTGPPH